ncbi:transposase [Spirillospora albida]
MGTTGSPWRDVPATYGNWSTIYDRFRAWACQGVFENGGLLPNVTPGPK